MKSIKFKRADSLAIDLGNNNTKLVGNTNNFLFYPSFVALNTSNNSVRAVGIEAFEMLGKTGANLRVVKPLKGGVIDDFESTKKMLQQLIDKEFNKRIIFRRFETIISSVPYSTTNVEKRALRDILQQIHPFRLFMVSEPISAAIGMGVDIRKPEGRFILDIGGGISEAVIISLSGIVISNSSRIGGDTLDIDIQDYFRRKHKMDISLNTAEKVKINVGAVMSNICNPPEPYYTVGKDTISGIPRGILIDHHEVSEILNNSITKIEQIVYQTLEECPPEIAGDIYNNGILVTGGSSLLRGLKIRLQKKIKIPVHMDSNPLFSVIWGNHAMLQNPAKYRSVFIN